ncbi:hypothetical protein [Undibacterium sp. Di24W]|uniref:hypothetical protein n=1 Tax=Undibacterium sp. Di24W TaxID=3413033 RepID=UPI003BF1F496
MISDIAIRQASYRNFFRKALEKKEIDDIRLALQQGQTVDREKFKEAMSAPSGASRMESRRGRPVKASNDVIEKLDQTDFGF